MQQAAHLNPPLDRDMRDLMSALPLYAASLLVTLVGVGAVGVTITSTTWTPFWATMAVIGHGVSIVMRRNRVSAETVFYPVMLIGLMLVLQQTISGGTVGGIEIGVAGQSMDMATATVVASLAVVRTFTLVTNSTLVFSPVPAITMLALVGSANLNAEVPLFFGLFLLASLFITGYEAHLRRAARAGRPAAPILFHLLVAWCMTLIVAGAASIFPLILQPTLGQLSPFNLPGINRFRPPNFTQNSQNRASVGAGPISLSPTPVYDVYTDSGPGRLRTYVYSTYSGKDWRPGATDQGVPLMAKDVASMERLPGEQGLAQYRHFLFTFEPDQELSSKVTHRDTRARLLTRSSAPQGVPAIGEITELRYPQSSIQRHTSGVFSGTSHTSMGKTFEVVSRVYEPTPAQLRKAPAVAAEEFTEPDTLELTQSTYPVQELARKVTGAASNNYDKVQAILKHIEDNCEYTLQEEVTPPGEDAAAFYLLKTKRGACDLAATATAVMARSVGIPARVAVGFLMDEPLPSGGGFLVRQEHSHMWAEVYFPGYGWIPFDPSPPLSRIRENPLQVLWARITGSLRYIGGGGMDALLLVVAVLGTLALAGSWLHGVITTQLRLRSRLRQLAQESPGGAAALAYDRAMRMLARRGWARQSWMTASEYLQSRRGAWADHPEAVAALERLTQLFEAAQYAGQGSAETAREMDAAIQELRRTMPPRPRAVPAPAPSSTATAVAEAV